MTWLKAHSSEAVETSPFHDESRFTRFRPDGRRRVYRRCGKRFANAYVTNGLGLGVAPLWSGEALRTV